MSKIKFLIMFVAILIFCFGAITGMTILSMALKGQL